MLFKNQITLASASPRRRELIKQITWLNAAFFAADCDESISGEIPENACITIARRKAEKVYSSVGGVVVGADTMVVTNCGKVLGKPANEHEALMMFKKLCGKTNYVVTGVCILSGAKKVEFYEKTFITFSAFNSKIVYNYIKTDLPYDKAGGFGLQDEQIRPLFLSVEGDVNNVYGLPTEKLNNALKEFF